MANEAKEGWADPAQLIRDADKRNINAMAREIARRTGVTTKYARKRLLEGMGEGRKI